MSVISDLVATNAFRFFDTNGSGIALSCDELPNSKYEIGKVDGAGYGLKPYSIYAKASIISALEALYLAHA